MSFTSDVVALVNEYLKDNQNIIQFCNEIVDEFTSPRNKIVLNYKETSITLLHVRHIISGAYISLEDEVLKEIINRNCILVNRPLTFPKNNEGNLDVKEVIKLLDNLRDKEGFVISFKDGEMVKAKST